MDKKENARPHFRKYRVLNMFYKITLDFLAVFVATFVTSFMLHLNSAEAIKPFSLYALLWLALHTVFAAISFVACRIYRISYRAFGMLDVMRLGCSLFGILLAELISVPFFKHFGVGITFAHAIFYFLLISIFICGIRIAIRMRMVLFAKQNGRGEKERVVIVGAGAAGTNIIRELQSTDKVAFKAVAALDDDLSKKGMYICGVRVVGAISEIKAVVEKYNATRVLVTMPSVHPQKLREVLKQCQSAGVRVQTLPGLYQLAAGTVSVSKMRDVEVQDLLGREQIKVNLHEIMGYIEDKVVLVTGGGGSIGSELCRQIATQRPRQLIIFDIYENNAYDIEQELRRQHAALNLLVLIGSVRDKGKIENLFEKYKPDIVFNAAAHKHVPLMETSPCEAVKNNVFGTLNVARAADKYGAERFVQISTDKAVNPTNIMGATKRICEMIIQTIGKRSKTNFVAVRFGNVLGSNGSVIPLFKRQIAEGGPVTVTHKDIIRYFMTIPEAVSLVLQAGAYAQGGEIYVLDMGEQVRIYDLAENLIRLSGYEPGVDIEIVCTGLRPGEKLYEERLMDEEGMQKTANNSISIGKPIEFDENVFYEKLDRLYEAAYAETEEMKELVHELVPTYTVDKR